MTYTLNADQARAADNRSTIINETGKYIGTITRAEKITAKTGTEGIDFSFKSEDGRNCRFALYTKKADGALVKSGHGLVMAMMTCLQVKTIDARLAKIKKWDKAANKEVDQDAQCFLDLMGKPIGVLFEVEEYEKSDGGIGKKPVLAGVFQASTELTASEILDRKTTPAQLEKIVATLRDRPMSQARPKQSAHADQGHAGADYDDEIPF